MQSLSTLVRFFDPALLGRKLRGALPFVCYRLHHPSPQHVQPNALRVWTWWGPVIVHAQSDSITSSLVKTGVYDLDLSLAILRSIKSSMVVCNIGANVGLYALLAARGAGKKGKVYAFEPDPRSFALLAMNAEQFPDVIEPVPFAVGDHDGELDLWLDDKEPGDSSFARGNVESSSAHRTRVCTLDHFCAEQGIVPHAIIMDIQGAEPLAFEGMKSTLRQPQLSTIFFECSPKYSENMGVSVSVIPQILHAAGFTIAHLRRSALPDPDTAWDALIQELHARKGGYGFCNLVARRTSL
ncbi:MAG TPA: FkbM family methyltransferase [Candidatus Peribacterales bacterium]|nr:FkbM family methyltransferase [Candidatus Peribacterales bacterium]